MNINRFLIYIQSLNSVSINFGGKWQYLGFSERVVRLKCQAHREACPAADVVSRVSQQGREGPRHIHNRGVQ